MLEKQSKKVRRFIIQVGGNMKTLITKVLFIFREWIKQHHEMERATNKIKSYDKK